MLENGKNGAVNGNFKQAFHLLMCGVYVRSLVTHAELLIFNLLFIKFFEEFLQVLRCKTIIKKNKEKSYFRVILR